MKARLAMCRIFYWICSTSPPYKPRASSKADPPALTVGQDPSDRTTEHRITVFLDEGALDGDARFPSVCAVIVGKVESVEAAIEETIHKLLLRPNFRLEPSAQKFQKNGFHHVDDNLLAKHTFIDLLPRLDFDWWCSSNLEPPLDSYETLSDQFEWLLERILQKLKDKEVLFVFEQNDRLNNKFAVIVKTAVEKTNYNPELVNHVVGTKKNRSLAIADYCIAIATQAIAAWMRACCDVAKAHKQHHYRTFASIEPSCSVLYSWDMKRSISGRSKRLTDRSYFEVSGRHHSTCSHGGSSEVSL